MLYWLCCTASSSYKRRITWLEPVSGRQDEAIAVVEYSGQFVSSAPHGLCKGDTKSAPYIRTPADTMDAIRDLTKQMPPHAVYNTLKAKFDIDDAPRNSAVVHDQAVRHKRKEREENGHSHCRTFADEFRAVFNMAQTDALQSADDRFVRVVIASEARVPSDILYTERQLRELKYFCFRGVAGSVLSVDKTFNLGNIYVTVCVYKNLALQRKRTGEHPVCIGPIFLHGHSDISTYSFFFSHIASRLHDCQFTSLTLGSDEEAAIRRCLSLAFSGSQIIACSRHIAENVTRKLETLYGSKTDEYRSLHKALLGDGGLSSCSDIVSFDATVDLIRNKELSNAPAKFVAYFCNRLVPLLRANVSAGRVGWTNNNAECVNHILKQSTQWRPQQLPDLIIKLKSLIIGQHTEADRAIVGRGDLLLMPTHVKYRLSLDQWKSLTDAQRQKAVDTCFRHTSTPSSISTDGDLTVPTTPNAGRKPHQRKRAEKTKTIAAKKCKFADSDTD